MVFLGIRSAGEVRVYHFETAPTGVNLALAYGTQVILISFLLKLREGSCLFFIQQLFGKQVAKFEILERWSKFQSGMERILVAGQSESNGERVMFGSEIDFGVHRRFFLLVDISVILARGVRLEVVEQSRNDNFALASSFTCHLITSI